jgi:hypothetical protein
MPVPPLETMPDGAHKAMHWAAKCARRTVENFAERGGGVMTATELESLFMQCFAAGAVWRDSHIEAPMVLECPEGTDGAGR